MVVGRSCHRWIDVVWVDCYIDVCGRAASRCDEPSQRENTEVVFSHLGCSQPSEIRIVRELREARWTFLDFFMIQRWVVQLCPFIDDIYIYIYKYIYMNMILYIVYIYIYIWASTQSIERVFSKVLWFNVRSNPKSDAQVWCSDARQSCGQLQARHCNAWYWITCRAP